MAQLIALPVELKQLILRSCDTPTYLQLAFSCWNLLLIASHTRVLVIHHLNETPGGPEDFDSISTTGLFRLLLQRSYRELYGAEHYFERKLVNLQGKVMNSRACSLRSRGEPGRALLSFQNDESVYLVKMDNRDLTLQQRIKLPAISTGTAEVLFAAEDTSDHNGVHILHIVKPLIDEEPYNGHPFVQQARKANSNGTVYLAFYPHALSGVGMSICSFREQIDYEPIAFATCRDVFAISWHHRQHPEDYQVVLYTVPLWADPKVEHGDGDWDEPKEANLVEPCQDDTSPLIGKPAILLHFKKAHPLYGSFQKLHDISRPRIDGQGLFSSPNGQPRLHDNACHVAFSDELALEFAIDIPFFSTHQAGDRSSGEPCHWQYLSIGIATHRVENWTVACLLKSESFPSAFRCDHQPNLDRGRRFDQWQIVARMDGYRESTTSNGPLIATSRLGTRIVVATWKTIYIWPVEPHALVNGDPNEFYPASWSSTEDMLVLRPVVIEMDAVCSQVDFTDNEDEMVALTDRGLMLLDFRPDGKGGLVTENWNDILNRSH
ncbi:hypothetical protein N7532_009111 [Penicillium argentinense]|uniref:Uncharacterized protein n=1 Tax=Penicillium argentinense TaxID=1131581 RepID=A0A9W9EYS3_9EURO|nr:uncharacterized protein N7532_009111 [Penicillium argentinense]KAJ5090427.1 hypothetical protein N7532_009111 [Penicillium argentinense]